jgi:hypothetical protein
MAQVGGEISDREIGTVAALSELTPGSPPADLLTHVRAALRRFAGEADPSDDIAMLAVRYGHSPRASGWAPAPGAGRPDRR